MGDGRCEACSECAEMSSVSRLICIGGSYSGSTAIAGSVSTASVSVCGRTQRCSAEQNDEFT
jgi:hypothetical protein